MAFTYALFETLETRRLLSAAPVVAFATATSHPLTQSAVVVAPKRVAKATDAPASVAAAIAAAKFSGPITITKGGVYSGNWQSDNPKIPAVRIRTSDAVIIENSIIRSRAACIDVFGGRARVTVRNTIGIGLNPNAAGMVVGRFLDVDGFVNIVATNNYLESTGGIYVSNYLGNRTPGQTVKVIGNVAKNIDGRASNGKGGWLLGSPDSDFYRQFFQINGVKNLAGIEVAWNQVVNELGRSRVEENINIYASSGTPGSPIAIHDNYIQGAFASDSVDARDYTGGGIMVSDNGSCYVQAFNNQIVGVGQQGITISSGHDNSFFNNRIISSGLDPNGVPLPYSNTGAAIWNANNESGFARNSGYNNLIGWVGPKGVRNDSWTPAASRWTGNVAWVGKITPATEAAEWNLWLDKLGKQGVVVGVGAVG